jgi:hypothetical protein
MESDYIYAILKMWSAIHHELIVYNNTPYPESLLDTHKDSSHQIYVIAKRTFIKTSVPNPVAGNTILPKIISPPMVKSLINLYIVFNCIKNFYLAYKEVKIVFSL